MILREKLWNVWNTKILILITIIITILISSYWWSDQGKQWSSKSRDNISFFTFFPPGVICKLVSHINDCPDCHLVGCAGVPLDTGGQVCLHVAPLHSLRPRVWGPVHFQNDGWDVGKLQINILLSDPWLFRLESGPILLAALGQPHSWVLKSWKGDCT